MLLRKSAVEGKADISRSCAVMVSKRWPVSTVVCQSGDPRNCATDGSPLDRQGESTPVSYQRRRQAGAGQRSKEAKSDPVADVGSLPPCCLRTA